MKKAILILFALFITSCSSNVEEESEEQEVLEEVIQEKKTSVLDNLIKYSININVGRPYKLLPILSNSKDHR
jgi:PBP1b-binding outer membrane lipoprotein LpoB